MKKLLLIFTLIAVFVIYKQGLTSQPNNSNESSTQTTEETKLETANVVIDYGDTQNSEYSFEITDTTTAYDLLLMAAQKEEMEVSSKQYDFGVFVEAIGDKKSSAEKAWIYFVNDASGQVAADKYIAKKDDKIEWKYVVPTN